MNTDMEKGNGEDTSFLDSVMESGDTSAIEKSTENGSTAMDGIVVDAASGGDIGKEADPEKEAKDRAEREADENGESMIEIPEGDEIGEQSKKQEGEGDKEGSSDEEKKDEESDGSSETKDDEKSSEDDKPSPREQYAKFLTDFPNADPSEALKMFGLDGKSGEQSNGNDGDGDGDGEVTASEALQTAKAELADVRAKIRDKDRILARDDEWEELTRKAEEIQDDILTLTAEANRESDARDRSEKEYEGVENQIKADPVLKDVYDDNSDLHAAVYGRSHQIAKMHQNGVKLPNGWKIDDPNLPMLVANEQAEKLGLKKAPDGKGNQPTKTGTSQQSQVIKSPVPGRVSSAASTPTGDANRTPTPTEVGVAKAVKATDEKSFFQGLDDMLGGGEGSSRGDSRISFK